MSILRYENVEWSLPYLFGFDVQMFKIIKTLQALELPYNFNSFGSLKSRWSGGRVSVISTEDKDFVTRLFSHLIDNGVIPSLTFTRSNITEDDLKDPFCNYILDVANDLGCNIIISSNLLFEYIKKKYPSITCTASVIKPIFEFQTPQKIAEYNVEEEIIFYNKLLKEYNKVVVRPEFAKFYLPDFYKEIQDISKIEVLVNQSCKPNCPIATNHYKYYEKVELLKEHPNDLYFECYYEKNQSTILEKANNTLHFEIEEIDKLVDIGIQYLKLQGRAGSLKNDMPFLYFYNYVLKPGGKTLNFQYAFENDKENIEHWFKTEILK